MRVRFGRPVFWGMAHLYYSSVVHLAIRQLLIRAMRFRAERRIASRLSEGLVFPAFLNEVFFGDLL